MLRSRRKERALTLGLSLALGLGGCLRANPDFLLEEPPPGAPDAASVAPDHALVAPPLAADAAAPDLAWPTPAPDAMWPDLLAPDLMPAPDTAPICATGETAFAGHCYRMIQSSLMTYPEARQLCKAQGALPVSIGSAAESSAIYALVPKNLQAVWIGLLRTGDGKKAFVWESGDPLGYASWAPGEPNNSDYQEDCVVIWGAAITTTSLAGAWNDATCWSLRGAVVCERAP